MVQVDGSNNYGTNYDYSYTPPSKSSYVDESIWLQTLLDDESTSAVAQDIKALNALDPSSETYKQDHARLSNSIITKLNGLSDEDALTVLNGLKEGGNHGLLAAVLGSRLSGSELKLKSSVLNAFISQLAGSGTTNQQVSNILNFLLTGASPKDAASILYQLSAGNNPGLRGLADSAIDALADYGSRTAPDILSNLHLLQANAVFPSATDSVYNAIFNQNGNLKEGLNINEIAGKDWNARDFARAVLMLEPEQGQALLQELSPSIRGQVLDTLAQTSPSKFNELITNAPPGLLANYLLNYKESVSIGEVANITNALAERSPQNAASFLDSVYKKNPDMFNELVKSSSVNPAAIAEWTSSTQAPEADVKNVLVQIYAQDRSFAIDVFVEMHNGFTDPAATNPILQGLVENEDSNISSDVSLVLDGIDPRSYDSGDMSNNASKVAENPESIVDMAQGKTTEEILTIISGVSDPKQRAAALEALDPQVRNDVLFLMSQTTPSAFTRILPELSQPVIGELLKNEVSADLLSTYEKQEAGDVGFQNNKALQQFLTDVMNGKIEGFPKENLDALLTDTDTSPALVASWFKTLERNDTNIAFITDTLLAMPPQQAEAVTAQITFGTSSDGDRLLATIAEHLEGNSSEGASRLLENIRIGRDDVELSPEQQAVADEIQANPSKINSHTDRDDLTLIIASLPKEDSLAAIEALGKADQDTQIQILTNLVRNFPESAKEIFKGLGVTLIGDVLSDPSLQGSPAVNSILTSLAEDKPNVLNELLTNSNISPAVLAGWFASGSVTPEDALMYLESLSGGSAEPSDKSLELMQHLATTGASFNTLLNLLSKSNDPALQSLGLGLARGLDNITALPSVEDDPDNAANAENAQRLIDNPEQTAELLAELGKDEHGYAVFAELVASLSPEQARDVLSRLHGNDFDAVVENLVTSTPNIASTIVSGADTAILDKVMGSQELSPDTKAFLLTKMFAYDPAKAVEAFDRLVTDGGEWRDMALDILNSKNFSTELGLSFLQQNALNDNDRIDFLIDALHAGVDTTSGSSLGNDGALRFSNEYTGNAHKILGELFKTNPELTEPFIQMLVQKSNQGGVEGAAASALLIKTENYVDPTTWNEKQQRREGRDSARAVDVYLADFEANPEATTDHFKNTFRDDVWANILMKVSPQAADAILANLPPEQAAAALITLRGIMPTRASALEGGLDETTKELVNLADGIFAAETPEERQAAFLAIPEDKRAFVLAALPLEMAGEILGRLPTEVRVELMAQIEPAELATIFDDTNDDDGVRAYLKELTDAGHGVHAQNTYYRYHSVQAGMLQAIDPSRAVPAIKNMITGEHPQWEAAVVQFKHLPPEQQANVIKDLVNNGEVDLAKELIGRCDFSTLALTFDELKYGDDALSETVLNNLMNDLGGDVKNALNKTMKTSFADISGEGFNEIFGLDEQLAYDILLTNLDNVDYANPDSVTNVADLFIGLDPKIQVEIITSIPEHKAAQLLNTVYTKAQDEGTLEFFDYYRNEQAKMAEQYGWGFYTEGYNQDFKQYGSSLFTFFQELNATDPSLANVLQNRLEDQDFKPTAFVLTDDYLSSTWKFDSARSIAEQIFALTRTFGGNQTPQGTQEMIREALATIPPSKVGEVMGELYAMEQEAPGSTGYSTTALFAGLPDDVKAGVVAYSLLDPSAAQPGSFANTLTQVVRTINADSHAASRLGLSKDTIDLATQAKNLLNGGQAPSSTAELASLLNVIDPNDALEIINRSGAPTAQFVAEILGSEAMSVEQKAEILLAIGKENPEFATQIFNEMQFGANDDTVKLMILGVMLKDPEGTHLINSLLESDGNFRTLYDAYADIQAWQNPHNHSFFRSIDLSSEMDIQNVASLIMALPPEQAAKLLANGNSATSAALAEIASQAENGNAVAARFLENLGEEAMKLDDAGFYKLIAPLLTYPKQETVEVDGETVTREVNVTDTLRIENLFNGNTAGIKSNPELIDRAQTSFISKVGDSRASAFVDGLVKNLDPETEWTGTVDPNTGVVDDSEAAKLEQRDATIKDLFLNTYGVNSVDQLSIAEQIALKQALAEAGIEVTSLTSIVSGNFDPVATNIIAAFELDLDALFGYDKAVSLLNSSFSSLPPSAQQAIAKEISDLPPDAAVQLLLKLNPSTQVAVVAELVQGNPPDIVIEFLNTLHRGGDGQGANFKPLLDFATELAGSYPLDYWAILEDLNFSTRDLDAASMAIFAGASTVASQPASAVFTQSIQELIDSGQQGLAAVIIGYASEPVLADSLDKIPNITDLLSHGITPNGVNVNLAEMRDTLNAHFSTIFNSVSKFLPGGSGPNGTDESSDKGTAFNNAVSQIESGQKVSTASFFFGMDGPTFAALLSNRYLDQDALASAMLGLPPDASAALLINTLKLGDAETNQDVLNLMDAMLLQNPELAYQTLQEMNVLDSAEFSSLMAELDYLDNIPTKELSLEHFPDVRLQAVMRDITGDDRFQTSYDRLISNDQLWILGEPDEFTQGLKVAIDATLGNVQTALFIATKDPSVITSANTDSSSGLWAALSSEISYGNNEAKELFTPMLQSIFASPGLSLSDENSLGYFSHIKNLGSLLNAINDPELAANVLTKVVNFTDGIDKMEAQFLNEMTGNADSLGVLDDALSWLKNNDRITFDTIASVTYVPAPGAIPLEHATIGVDKLNKAISQVR